VGRAPRRAGAGRGGRAEEVGAVPRAVGQPSAGQGISTAFAAI